MAGDSSGDEDLVLEVAGAIDPASDGFGVKGTVSAVHVAAISPKPEPIPVSDQFFACIAQEIGRRIVAVSRTTPRPTTSTVQQVASQDVETRSLNRAMRLTRDAVYAWVNVLTGPAIVTVSHSR
jgi:hypothetical protein